MRFLFWILSLVLALAGTGFIIYKAVQSRGKFTNLLVLKYSAAIGFLFAFSLRQYVYGETLIDIFYYSDFSWWAIQRTFILMLSIIFFTLILTSVIALHWMFYRFVAGKAEAAGSSYVGFMVLAIFAPLIALIIALTLKPANGSLTGHTRNQNIPYSPPASYTPPVNASLSDELAKLQKLKDSGVLTEAEFQKAKSKLIS